MPAEKPSGTNRQDRMKPGSGNLFAIITIALLALAVLGMILSLSVPVFYMDDWTVIGLLEKIRSHTVGFHDFWVTHNEHRIFLPRLLYVAIYSFAGPNPQLLMGFSWLIMATCTVMACHQLFLRRDTQSGLLWKSVYAIAFAAILFAFVQYENWLWAFELQIFLTQVFVLGVAVLLATKSWGFYRKLFGITFCAIGASCSTGQGILLWPSAAVGLLIDARHGRHRCLAIGLCLFGFLFFSWQYRFEAGGLHSALPFMWILERPSDFVRAFLALVGGPLTYSAGDRRLVLAPMVGFLVLVGLLLEIFSIWRSKQICAAAPFLVLISFGLLFCLLVALGRASESYNEWFLTSRYTTHALLIPAGMLGLGWLVRYSGSTTRSINSVLVDDRPFLAIMCILILGGTPQAISWAADESEARRFSQHLIPIVDEVAPNIDGVVTGPYYPLCPADNSKLMEWGIRPAIAVGLLKQEHVNRSVTPITELHMDYETKPHARQYLGHPIYAPLFSGSLAVPKGCQPDALLIRQNEGIILAAPLHLSSPHGRPFNVYKWAVPISPSMNPASFQPADVMLYGWRRGPTLWKIEPSRD